MLIRFQSLEEFQSILCLKDKETKEMAKLKITQVKSKIGSTKRQRETLTTLGLKKINYSVEREETPSLLGQIEKVRHLIKVEEVK